IISESQYGLFMVCEDGRLDGGIAQGGDLAILDADLAGDALVLEDFVGGAAQPADAENRELAQLPIELAAIPQPDANACGGLQAGRRVGQHAEDVELRRELPQELVVPAGGLLDVEIWNSRHEPLSLWRASLKHIPFGWNQPNGMCLLQRLMPVRAFPI